MLIENCNAVAVPLISLMYGCILLSAPTYHPVPLPSLPSPPSSLSFSPPVLAPPLFKGVRGITSEIFLNRVCTYVRNSRFCVNSLCRISYIFKIIFFLQYAMIVDCDRLTCV
jgi:hypothetical protein